VEHRASTNQGNQMWCIHGPPAGLCGIDELVGHGNSRGTGSRALGDLRPQPHGRERRLNRIRTTGNVSRATTVMPKSSSPNPGGSFWHRSEP
jgi:hypothetical protein